LYISTLLSNALGIACLREILHPQAGAASLTAGQFGCAKAALHALGGQTLGLAVKLLFLLAAFYAANARVYFRRYVDLGPEHRAQRARIADLAARFYPGTTLAVARARSGRSTKTHTAGTARKPHVVFSSEDLACLVSPDPARRRLFDAVVLHELAHVNAGDLRRYQWARAVRALVIVQVGLCLMVFAITPHSLAGVAVLQIVVLAVTAELVVRAFLRARESWADVRAAAADRVSLEFAAALARNGSKGSPFATHPTRAQRLSALREPATLLRFPAWYSLGAGFLGGLALSMFTFVIGELYWGTKLAGQEAAVAVYVAGIPLVVALCLGTWRQVWADQISGQPSRSAAHTVALAGGLFVGQYASPLFTFARGFFVPSEIVPIAAATAVTALALIRWPTAVAAGWFPPAIPGLDEGLGDVSATFRGMKPVGIVVAFLVMGRMLAAWLLFCRLADLAVVPPYGSQLPPNLSHYSVPLLGAVLRSATAGWQAALVLSLAWILPLAPRTMSPIYRAATSSDGLARRARRHGMFWGAAALAICAVGLPISARLRVWAGLGAPLSVRSTLIVIAMVLAAATTSARIRGPLAGPYAMAAAFVTALIGLASLPVGSSGPAAQNILDVLTRGQLLAASSSVAMSCTIRTVVSCAGIRRRARWPAARIPPEPAPARRDAKPTAAAVRIVGFWTRKQTCVR
jgi:Zn-dependent protease with chaperone function